MTKGPAYGSGRPLPERRGRRWLPFWVIQATEIVVAVVFVDASIHVSNGKLLVVGALAFFALAVTAHGPLGIVRICNQSLHLFLAVVVAVLVAIAPILPALRPDIEGIIVVEFGAIGVIRLATLTRSTSAPLGPWQKARSRADATVIDATATVVDARPTSSAHRSGSDSSRPGSGGPTSPDAPARRVGRVRISPVLPANMACFGGTGCCTDEFETRSSSSRACSKRGSEGGPPVKLLIPKGHCFRLSNRLRLGR